MTPQFQSQSLINIYIRACSAICFPPGPTRRRKRLRTMLEGRWELLRTALEELGVAVAGEREVWESLKMEMVLKGDMDKVS